METKNFSADLLRSFKVGDTFITEGFFQGVSPLPCEWKVVSSKDNGTYTLLVTYGGIAVGKFFVSVKKDKYRLEEITL